MTIHTKQACTDTAIRMANYGNTYLTITHRRKVMERMLAGSPHIKAARAAFDNEVAQIAKAKRIWTTVFV